MVTTSYTDWTLSGESRQIGTAVEVAGTKMTVLSIDVASAREIDFRRKLYQCLRCGSIDYTRFRPYPGCLTCGGTGPPMEIIKKDWAELTKRLMGFEDKDCSVTLRADLSIPCSGPSEIYNARTIDLGVIFGGSIRAYVKDIRERREVSRADQMPLSTYVTTARYDVTVPKYVTISCVAEVFLLVVGCEEVSTILDKMRLI